MGLKKILLENKKVALLLVILLSLLVFLIPAVYAQEEGIYDALTEIADLFIESVKAIMNTDKLNSVEDQILFFRFGYGVLAFLIVFAGTSAIPSFNKRIGGAIAFVFAALGAYTVPSQTIYDLAQIYKIAFVAIFSFAIPFAIIFLAWSFPKNVVGRFLALIIVIFGIVILASINGAFQSFYGLTQNAASNLGTIF